MPDNSMEFVRYALASEGNCLEADIRRNRDGELILSHDETEEGGGLAGPVFELLKEKPEKKDQLRSENAGGWRSPYTSWQRSMAWRDS